MIILGTAFSLGASGSVTGSAVDAFEIDLSDMLDGPGSSEVSMQSFDDGIAVCGVSVSGGVEVSVGAPGGIPERASMRAASSTSPATT
ncbi:hypothetical protein GS500_14910 [Rhodococcus hoagii]|nr:hypothetical protein [Prescottella equi]